MIASNRPSDIAQNSSGPSNETRGSAVTTPTADPVVSAVMAQRDKPHCAASTAIDRAGRVWFGSIPGAFHRVAVAPARHVAPETYITATRSRKREKYHRIYSKAP